MSADDLIDELTSENKRLRGIIARKDREIKRLKRANAATVAQVERQSIALLEEKYEKGLTSLHRSRMRD